MTTVHSSIVLQISSKISIQVRILNNNCVICFSQENLSLQGQQLLPCDLFFKLNQQIISLLLTLRQISRISSNQSFQHSCLSFHIHIILRRIISSAISEIWLCRHKHVITVNARIVLSFRLCQGQVETVWVFLFYLFIRLSVGVEWGYVHADKALRKFSTVEVAFS